MLQFLQSYQKKSSSEESLLGPAGDNFGLLLEDPFLEICLTLLLGFWELSEDSEELELSEDEEELDDVPDDDPDPESELELEDDEDKWPEDLDFFRFFRTILSLENNKKSRLRFEFRRENWVNSHPVSIVSSLAFFESAKSHLGHFHFCLVSCLASSLVKLRQDVWYHSSQKSHPIMPGRSGSRHKQYFVVASWSLSVSGGWLLRFFRLLWFCDGLSGFVLLFGLSSFFGVAWNVNIWKY